MAPVLMAPVLMAPCAHGTRAHGACAHGACAHGALCSWHPCSWRLCSWRLCSWRPVLMAPVVRWAALSCHGQELAAFPQLLHTFAHMPNGAQPTPGSPSPTHRIAWPPNTDASSEQVDLLGQVPLQNKQTGGARRL